MRISVRLATIGVLIAVLSGTAVAADFEEYARLVELAREALEQLEDAPSEQLDALRRSALAADFAVIDWLDAFFEDPEFQTLPEEHQALAYRDRYRNEFNASRILIELGECAQARDRLRALLDSAVNDDEVRPLLTTTYEQAVVCAATAARPSRISVRCDPVAAEVAADGVSLGLCTEWHELDPGQYVLTVSADGYLDATQEIELAAGEELELGPFVLEQDVGLVEPGPASSSRSPDVLHWTLWGVGAAGVGTGVGLFISAAQLQDGIDNPPAGHEVADRSGEQDKVDRRMLFGYVAAGAGLAAAITGTVLYLLSSESEQSDVAWSVEPSRNGIGGTLQVRF